MYFHIQAVTAAVTTYQHQILNDGLNQPLNYVDLDDELALETLADSYLNS